MRVDQFYPVALLFAAGYLVVTRRRSRRAALAGLSGIALLGVLVVFFLMGTDYNRLLRAAGWADDQTRRVAYPWIEACHRGLAYGLLIWAVLVDRRPPANDDE